MTVKIKPDTGLAWKLITKDISLRRPCINPNGGYIIHTSVMTMGDFNSEAKFLIDSYIHMNILKGFFESCEKLSIFLQNKQCLEMNKIDDVFNKSEFDLIHNEIPQLSSWHIYSFKTCTYGTWGHLLSKTTFFKKKWNIDFINVFSKIIKRCLWSTWATYRIGGYRTLLLIRTPGDASWTHNGHFWQLFVQY